MGRIRVLVRNSVSITLVFCLLQISACGGQESADSGTTGKQVQEMAGQILCTILSEAVSGIENTKFLTNDAIVRDTDKESKQALDQSDEFIVDSTENIVSGEEEESLFDAYEIEKKEYLYFEDDAHLHVAICYPQLHGFKDINKEKKINQLIEEEAKRMIPYDLVDDFSLQENKYPDYIMGLYLLYEIKYMNDDIVSIFYEGLRGRIDSGYYPEIMAMATTIDLQTAEVVALTDIVADMEELCTLLLEDQFENISIWDGMPSDKRISNEYPDSQGRKALLEALYGTHEYKVIEWYTDGDNLVIVTTDYDYEEYSAGIDFYPDLVDENFREKLRAED